MSKFIFLRDLRRAARQASIELLFLAVALFTYYPIFAFAQASDVDNAMPTRVGSMLSHPLTPLHFSPEAQLKFVDKSPTSANDEWVDLYEKVSRSVLRLFVIERLSDTRQRVVASGSAVAIDAQALITNCHINRDLNRQVLARDAKGTRYPLELYAEDRQTDRCIYKSKTAEFEPVRAIRLAASVRVGEKVVAIGHPRGFEGVLTEGLIASVRIRGERKIFLTSANIAKGSSGGGLFDSAGNLIGVTTGIVNEAQYLGVVIPASDFFSRP